MPKQDLSKVANFGIKNVYLQIVQDKNRVISNCSLCWRLFCIFCLSVIWRHSAFAQYYNEHHIAPAPWLYWHDANEIILATPSDTNINIEVRKSDGTFLTTLTAKEGMPAVFRPTGNFRDVNRYPLNSIIKGAGIHLKSDQIFSVNVRNVASDQLGTDAYIKGNASLTSLGNPGIGLAFRVGYYRDGPLPSELPVYTIMAIYDQTQVSINGVQTIELHAGECYLFRSAIGSLVEASKPCVMNTSAFMDAPGGCGDGTFDQIPPVSSLGNRYFIVRTQGNSISEQSSIVAVEDSTTITINRFNASGGFLTSTMSILPTAGNFLTISNGDGATPFSVAEIVSDKKLAVFTGSAQSCEVDISTSFPVSSPCNGSNFVETSQFKAYRGNDLPYFCYILLEDANAQVNFNGADLETIVSIRKQIGSTNWYMINFNSNQVGNPKTISISSSVKLYVAIIQIGGGFSMSATFSNLIEQPALPNVLYIKQGECPTGSALLTAGSKGTQYQWYLDGKVISGANDSFFLATQAGVYHISELLPCGEFQESAPVSVVFDSIPSGRLSVEACGFFSWNDSTYTESGTYSILTQNASGCDSLAKLDLRIHKTSQTPLFEVSCEQFTWQARNETYDKSGIYRDTLVNQFGCDSILILNLSILKSNLETFKVEACKSYYWPVSKLYYNLSGIYRDTLVNSLGCDSILELQLKISEPSFQNISIRSCKSYNWPVNGKQYDQSGTYSDTLLTVNGCDSILLLELEILSENRIEETIKSCDTYRWPSNDRLYAKSGTYTELFKNTNGCDSLRILHLNILERSSDTLRVGQCNYYKWPLNGRDLYKSGRYWDTLQNHLGCDSIVLLDLAIYPDYQRRDTQRQCGSYYWIPAKKNYNASGDYKLALQSKHGCDSLIHLHLTVDPHIHITDTVSALGRYFWPVTNRIYDQAGIYESRYQTVNGCDSLYVLILQIRKRGDVFIPNVFTPNGDGVNDRFTVFSTPEIKEIQRLRLYDRWGQLLYELKNFPPNDVSYGWDGNFRNQKSNPAVFVCTVEWIDSEGELHILSGDVTLIR
ncbi:MAG: gliding motility-associated C-terminal domain-containing protein [Saprospiraceae bacterium]|nr:gliding motility-associated C-terminal domain-containing protein [Saprospiraceae bacterium]